MDYIYFLVYCMMGILMVASAFAVHFIFELVRFEIQCSKERKNEKCAQRTNK